MSGVEFLGGNDSDDWHDSGVSGEHFRGTVATGKMSDEEAARLQAHFDAARKPGLISRTVNRIANALGLRQETTQAAQARRGGAVIGASIPDGTIYAGISPDSQKPMYAAPADAKLTMKWKQAMDYAARL